VKLCDNALRCEDGLTELEDALCFEDVLCLDDVLCFEMKVKLDRFE